MVTCENAEAEQPAQITAEELLSELKPLSGNAFIRFFQRIWHWWLCVWYGFADRHPTLSPWIYKVFFFFVFSIGVTVWQFILIAFLPYAFTGLGTKSWGWPNVPVGDFTANGATYIIFGDPNGLGYFIAFEIAVFTAQCINFPLQRNITYRSHGNPWYQAMWYFIGWVLVSVFTNALWGIINVFFTHWGWYLEGNTGLATVAGLVKTLLTGGVSMAIFFFIFLIIFPDNKAAAKRARARAEKLAASASSAKKAEAAKVRYEQFRRRTDLSEAERAAHMARSRFNGAAMKYIVAKRRLERAKAQKTLSDGEQAKAAAAEAKLNEARAALAVMREKVSLYNGIKQAGAADNRI